MQLINAIKEVGRVGLCGLAVKAAAELWWDEEGDELYQCLKTECGTGAGSWDNAEGFSFKVAKRKRRKKQASGRKSSLQGAGVG